MKKYSVLLLFCLITVRAFPQSTGVSPDTAGPAQRPNIIFILTDDQRWDALGYAGNKLISTPEMDKLARQGTYFRQALVTTPICAASRASILSGMHERTHGYNFQTGPIGDQYMEDAYPRMMREAGYYTGFFGKFGVKYDHKDQLFDVYDDYDRNNAYHDRRGYYYKTLNGDTVHLTRYTGQQALDFIEQAPTDQPFCLSLSFSAPHAHDGAPDQYFWQPETASLLENTTIPPPDLAEDRYFDAQPAPVRNGFNRLRWHWRYDTPEKYQHSVKGYYRMISGIDREIAKIRQQLAKRGLDQNTVIILMGDNGYFMGERQLAGKWLLYDNSIRVPLVVYDPRVNKHQDLDEMALNIDVPPTILELAGVKRPSVYQGKSLLPMVTGRTTSLNRDTVLIEHLWEFDNIPPSEGVRTQDWKYFRYVNDKSVEELYHLQQDPQETDNLAKQAKYQKVLAEFRQKCDQLIRKYHDPYSAPPDGLMVEFVRQPDQITINDSLPEYSWVVPSSALSQNAYQVLVASSQQTIDQNIGDVWNSGQVWGNPSANVSQQGSPLQPDTRYFWKVRVWDHNNRTSEYSAAQSFQTGRLGVATTTADSSGRGPFQIDRIAPQSVAKVTDNRYFVDFGKDAFGTIELTYTAPAADTLTVRLGEKRKGDQLDRNPGGTIRYQEVKLPVGPTRKSYTLPLTPDARNTLPAAAALPDSFGVIMPFRYVELDGVSGKWTADDIRQKAYHYYWDEEASSFTSSDTTLNRIWDLCKYSIKATSFAGVYVDGDRERIPYEADAYINQLGHYATDREYAMAQRTIEYFMQHPTWPTEWLLHTALMVYQDYLYSGNTEIIEQYYEPLKAKTLIGLAREDGLISTDSQRVTGPFMAQLGFADTTHRLKDIVDWPPAQKDTGWELATPQGERDGYEMVPINTVVNSFFYRNMKIMAELARVLDQPEDEQHYRLMAEKVKTAINQQLFDPKRGIYVDGEGSSHASLHANMMPLAFGIVPKKYQKSVVDFIKSRGMACSVYGAQFLLEGLYEAGEAEYALSLMTATHDRSWWNMIAIGSTITLEAWDMKYKPNADWNHAWGAAPANIIPRYLWGITPKTPAFGIISIRPQFGGLKETTIQVPTIKGPVTGSYTYVNDRHQEYTIELPANTVGELHLAPNPNQVVQLNGEAVDMAFDTIRLRPGVNEIAVNINSF